MNYLKLKYITGSRKETGSTLLVIIIAIIVIAVLGVAIYTLTSTAILNQVVAQRATRAFYLSESGIRIAASEYKAAAAASKNATMIALHNKTFTMPDNVSTIQIKVYPYWFYANANFGVGATSITLYLPGDIPRVDDSDAPITFPTSGLLRIKDSGRTTPWVGSIASTTFVNYDSVTVNPTFDPINGTQVTFTLTAAFQAPNQIVLGDEFYIGNYYISSQTAPNQGGNLILDLDAVDSDDKTAKIFPPQKGTIFVVTSSTLSLYSYDTRIITTTASPHTVSLTNIQPITGAPVPHWPLTVLAGTQIYVGKSIGFRSTSNYGN